MCIRKLFPVCCDNQNKMENFRGIIEKKSPYVLPLCCPASFMNLHGKNITPRNVMKNVMKIQKFFRGHHIPLGRRVRKEGKMNFYQMIPGGKRKKSAFLDL